MTGTGYPPQVPSIEEHRGIRYAAAPIGRRRWREAGPVTATGATGATGVFVSCPQIRDGGAFDRTFPLRGEVTEDCLAVDVWTDGSAPAKPVAVWIHGGGFATGSAGEPMCDGRRLAEAGIVVVTVGYRLGALGFLDANLGLLDQLAALRWVAANIATFGGDPDRVTLMGSSAGAMSIACLLAIPEAHGLFHQVVLQSGAADVGVSPAAAGRVHAALRTALGVAPGRSLQDVPVEDVLAAQAAVLRAASAPGSTLLDEAHSLAMAFQPVFGVPPLAGPVAATIAAGPVPRVPVLLGTTLDEWRLFSRLAGGDPPDRAEVDRRIDAVAAATGADRAALGRAEGDESPADHWDRLQTERIFRMPALRLAEDLVRHGLPVWVYRFDWRPPVDPLALGATHGIEVPFVFDTLAGATGTTLAGGAPDALRQAVSDTWRTFVATGRPHPEPGRWPSYSPPERRVGLFGADGLEVVDDPDATVRPRWAPA